MAPPPARAEQSAAGCGRPPWHRFEWSGWSGAGEGQRCLGVRPLDEATPWPRSVLRDEPRRVRDRKRPLGASLWLRSPRSLDRNGTLSRVLGNEGRRYRYPPGDVLAGGRPPGPCPVLAKEAAGSDAAPFPSRLSSLPSSRCRPIVGARGHPLEVPDGPAGGQWLGPEPRP